MKFSINQKVEVDIKTLHVKAGARYWEDATVNGVEDVEGNLIPCRVDDYWCPIIDVESGRITNWKNGTTADIHYKVCDDGIYTLKDENEKTILEVEGYVIDILAIEDSGYGDYIILKVDENGYINNWKFNIDDFADEED